MLKSSHGRITNRFAVGHFALGYILSKSAAQKLKTELNVPIVLTLSVIPDIDILIPFLKHRGPTHSVIIAIIVFIPILAFWRRKAIPYFIALAQHSVLSDVIIGGQTQLFWPLTSGYYGMEINIKSYTNICIEWLSFLAAITLLTKTKDIKKLLQPYNSNLILIIPVTTILLPTFLAYPIDVPPALIPPHAVFLSLFLASFLIDLRQIYKIRGKP